MENKYVVERISYFCDETISWIIRFNLQNFERTIDFEIISVHIALYIVRKINDNRLNHVRDNVIIQLIK